MNQFLVNRLVKEINGQTFEFHMPVDADLGVAYEVIYQMFTIIGKNIEDRNAKAAEDSTKFKKEENSVEEVKDKK